MSWFEDVMKETPEERRFFEACLVGQNEWRAEENLKRALLWEHRMGNVAAQSFAPEGHYAYEFDELGIEHLSMHAQLVEDDDDEGYPQIRIRAATRRV